MLKMEKHKKTILFSKHKNNIQVLCIFLKPWHKTPWVCSKSETANGFWFWHQATKSHLFERVCFLFLAKYWISRKMQLILTGLSNSWIFGAVPRTYFVILLCYGKYCYVQKIQRQYEMSVITVCSCRNSHGSTILQDLASPLCYCQGFPNILSQS